MRDKSVQSSNNLYLGIRPGDLDNKPYAKYWNPEMGPLQDHVQQALTHGVEASELGFEITEADQLLEPGYLPLENGFTRLGNGHIFVAVLTKMPGVSGEMIDWWIGWTIWKMSATNCGILALIWRIVQQNDW